MEMKKTLLILLCTMIFATMFVFAANESNTSSVETNVSVNATINETIENVTINETVADNLTSNTTELNITPIDVANVTTDNVDSENITTNVTVAVEKVSKYEKMEISIRSLDLEALAISREVDMNAAINYLDKTGVDTKKLSSILKDFKENAESISDIATHDDADELVSKIDANLKEFRLEVRSKLEEGNGTTIGLVTQLDEEKKLSLNKVTTKQYDAWNNKKKVMVTLLNNKIDEAKIIVEELENNAAALKQLDEIEDKIDDLETALGIRDSEKVQEILMEIKSDSEVLKSLVIQTQSEIPKDLVAKYWIDVGSNTISATENVLSVLKETSAVTLKLEELQTKVSEQIDQAKVSFKKGDIDSTISDLRPIQVSLSKIREEYKNILEDEDLEDEDEKLVKTTSNALESLVAKIKVSL